MKLIKRLAKKPACRNLDNKRQKKGKSKNNYTVNKKIYCAGLYILSPKSLASLKNSSFNKCSSNAVNS